MSMYRNPRNIPPNMIYNPNNPPQRVRPPYIQQRPPIRRMTDPSEIASSDVAKEAIYQDRMRQIKAGIPPQGLETRIFYDKEVYDEEEEESEQTERKEISDRFQHNNQLMEAILCRTDKESVLKEKDFVAIKKAGAQLDDLVKAQEDSLEEMTKRHKDTRDRWYRGMEAHRKSLTEVDSQPQGKRLSIPSWSNNVIEGVIIDPTDYEERPNLKIIDLTPRVTRFRVPQTVNGGRPELENVSPPLSDPHLQRPPDGSQWNPRPIMTPFQNVPMRGRPDGGYPVRAQIYGPRVRMGQEQMYYAYPRGIPYGQYPHQGGYQVVQPQMGMPSHQMYNPGMRPGQEWANQPFRLRVPSDIPQKPTQPRSLE